jgi:hypothetical protein
MESDFYTKDTLERAKVVEESFRVQPGLYLIGSLERGLTVYNQQLRAHNLVWSLWELREHIHRRNDIKVCHVAIVGGGIAGLTAAACFLSRFDKISVTVFEQLWDLCPLQQGADNRWLHPRIYDWPAPGSRAPGASLPILNWSEGRASDVARTIVSEFGKFSEVFATSKKSLDVLLGLRHFRINAAKNEIEWVANRAKRTDAFFQIGEAEGGSAVFDTIVLAAGFGLETLSPSYPTNSYWRNEQFGQPLLDGTRQNFLVSGFGDGALIDLCRLTIERFRQDTILYELFPRTLEEVEEKFEEALRSRDPGEDAFNFFSKFEGDEIFENARAELSKRIRKDTRVALHISGKDGKVKTFSHIFGPYSSFLNRMMVFLLYKCGAFSISMADLATAVRRHGAPPENVLCRYGADPLAHLRAMFSDVERVEEQLINIRKCQGQKPKQFWQPGTFPHYSDPKYSDLKG